MPVSLFDFGSPELEERKRGSLPFCVGRDHEGTTPGSAKSIIPARAIVVVDVSIRKIAKKAWLG
jgi:hypothetical protein